MSDARETARLLVMRAAEWSRDNRGRGEHLSFNTQDLRDRIALVAERPATTSASDFAEQPDRLASIRERLGKATPGPARRRSHLELSPADRDFIANAREDMAWLLAHFPAPTGSAAIAAPDGATAPWMEEVGRPITPEDTLKCTEGGPHGATVPGAGEALDELLDELTGIGGAYDRICDQAEEDALNAREAEVRAKIKAIAAPPAAGSREARLADALRAGVAIIAEITSGDWLPEGRRELCDQWRLDVATLAPAPEPRPQEGPTPA